MSPDGDAVLSDGRPRFRAEALAAHRSGPPPIAPPPDDRRALLLVGVALMLGLVAAVTLLFAVHVDRLAAGAYRRTGGDEAVVMLPPVAASALAPGAAMRIDDGGGHRIDITVIEVLPPIAAGSVDPTLPDAARLTSGGAVARATVLLPRTAAARGRAEVVMSRPNLAELVWPGRGR